jgi:hypothetical protein
MEGGLKSRLAAVVRISGQEEIADRVMKLLAHKIETIGIAPGEEVVPSETKFV